MIGGYNDRCAGPRPGRYTGTEVYVNYFGIREEEFFETVETEIMAIRMAEILKGPQEWVFNSPHLHEEGRCQTATFII